MSDSTTRPPVRTVRSGRGRLSGVLVLDPPDPAAAAAALAERVRDGDAVEVRGDLVVVTANGLLTERDLRLLASRLLPVVVDRGITGPTGTGLAIGAAGEGEELVARAVEARAVSGRSGGAVVVHDAAVAAAAADRRRLLADLVAAVTAGRFEAHLQPVVDLGDGRLERVEALARWRDPVRQVVRPAAFVDAAVEAGVLDAITGQVAGQALARVLAWDRIGPRPLRVVIELHPTQVAAAVDIASRSLSAAGADPERLILTLPPAPVGELDRDGLAALGVGLAVGDPAPGAVGSATTVQVHWSRLPLPAATARGRTVVARGIETPGDLERARSGGADLGQGFAVHRPVAPERLEALVSAGVVPLDA